jgi:hypothetical protein
MLVFQDLQKKNLDKCCIFFEYLLTYTANFRTLLSGARVAPTSQDRAPVMLYLLPTVGNEKHYVVVVASNGITFEPNFVKVD